ncbi:hypothetical protein LIER_23111 [Lithospermum erythrorhizon]|uniref:Retrovirus-related Pol polyprotein from transposon TNT 1-94-like beta-barrel domain-containing protein n=1 Tax=Lithospermum erythrorhizon TaxID=34254 RepID=A0AAV3QXK7_LITER
MINTLRREFELLEMKKGETIESYFAIVNTVSNRLRNNGDDMSEVKIVEKILRTMTDEFTYVVVSIEESNDIEAMTMDELQSTLFTHEQKLNKKRNTEDEQYECPKWNKEANFAEVDEKEEEMLLMACTEETQTAGKKGTWFIDSGCSNHMCNDAEMFTTMDSSFNHYVKLGNNSRMVVSVAREGINSVVWA